MLNISLKITTIHLSKFTSLLALLGSLDPHVGGVDYQPLINQVNHLNTMQTAMNSIVHPGGYWNWRSETSGLIDSWRT
jgi:hypothetical protein